MLLPLCLVVLTSPALAADYSLTSSANYNAMFTGPPRAGGSSTMLSRDGALVVGDVNGDLVDDLVMAAYTDYNGSMSGSVWVLFGGETWGGDKPLGTTSNFNIRFDGPTGGYLSDHGGLEIGDVNGDGKGDLIISSYSYGNGTAWVIFSTLIDDYTGTTENVLRLDQPDCGGDYCYHLRYDGPSGGDLTRDRVMKIGDVNGDGKGDLLLGGYNYDYNGSSSGSVWVMFSTLIDDVGSTVGNNKSLGTDGSFNVRFDGGAAVDYLGGNGSLQVGDLNGDGWGDLVLGAKYADGGGSSSGSAWVIFSTLIDDVGETTGNKWQLNQQDCGGDYCYNIRYDGPGAVSYLTNGGSIRIGDVNGDEKGDLILGATGTNDSAGSAWVIFSTLIDDIGSTVGNNLQLNQQDCGGDYCYNIRYDGSESWDGLTKRGAIAVGDVNGDGKGDLIVGSDEANSWYGAFWVMFSTLIDDVVSTVGNNKSLATAANYNLRYDGEGACDQLGYYNPPLVGDANGDGFGDLLLGSEYNDYVSSGGSVWVMYSTLIDDIGTETGNFRPLYNSSYYSSRYDGQVRLGTGFYAAPKGNMATGDLNGDGRDDLILGDAWYYSGSSLGSVWVIYGFPHTVSLTGISSTNDTTPTFSGSVAATNSVTNIAGVEYQVDGISGSWTACTASDGSFNSTAEDYSCTLAELEEGEHTVYIRAYDVNYSYTTSGAYASDTFIVDVTDPILSLVSAAPSSTSATITWTTDEASSTRVEYGLTSIYGSLNSHTDTSPRVTSHTSTLSNLVSCTTYHYRATSFDAASNQGVSADATVTTTGCMGSASVSSQTAETITTSGGSLSLLDANSQGLSLTIPASFYSSTATFQAKQLDSTSVLASTSTPSGKEIVGTHTYDLESLTDPATTLTTFNQPLTITISYASSDLSSTVVPSTLIIYRYTDSAWQALTDCSVDTANQTVTCTTSSF